MFKREFLDIVDEDWAEVEKMNSWLQDLNSLKLSEIRVEGSLEKSKIAWKIAILSQAYLYRLHELGESCAAAWNAGNYIASLTLARSIIETGVVFCDLDENVQEGLNGKDLEFLDKDVMSKTFSTRIEDLIGEEGRFKAKNILTFIQKKEREIPGLESVYAHLSECTHPNQFGNFQHYGNLDRTNGTVTYSSGTFLKAKFHSVICAFFFIGFGRNAFIRLQKNIEHVAMLQHQINPVKS